MKRVATIQDFSCVGKCSLSVALPIISAAGVEACGIPTALLSNHTGFTRFHIRDLTDELLPVSETLNSLDIGFDAIYTGYAANSRQIELISGLVDGYREQGAMIFVDPVMGDDGRLYSGLTEDFPQYMRKLCADADLIMPNMTEACLLIGREYIASPTAEQLHEVLYALLELGAKKAVITGATRDNGRITGALGFDGKRFYEAYTQVQPLVCWGTGDIFASSLVGAVMSGHDFQRALEIAVGYTYECVRLTALDPDRRTYGVNFEQALPEYIRLLSSV